MQEVLEKIVGGLHELVELLRDDPGPCSYECSAFKLGVLLKNMRAVRLDPKPATPMLGYSVEALMNAAQNFRSPGLPVRIQRQDSWGGAIDMQHTVRECHDLQSLVQSKTADLEEMMGGLALEDFGGDR